MTDGRQRRGAIRRWRVADFAEDGVEPLGPVHPGCQVVIGRQGLGRLVRQVTQRFDLVFQHLEDQPRILFGIVDVTGLQASVVIVLDQMVIGVARKGQRVEP